MVKLASLLKRVTYECLSGREDVLVSTVSYDSRNVTKDGMFICIEGANSDGHDYIEEVIEKGATVIVLSNCNKFSIDAGLPIDKEVTILRVADTRYAMAFISAAYFENPANQLKIIGITGTKGKTTTAYLVKSMLEKSGLKVGLIGTIEVIIGDRQIPANNTTPESYLLQSYFKDMVEAGCQVVVMEVSSQGLMLHRTQGFEFELGILTNMEPDHIGPNEHESFEQYMACKGLLFKQCKVGIVNCDDLHYQEVIKGYTCQLETYGFNEEANLRADNIQLINKAGYLGVKFDVSGIMVDCKMENNGPTSIFTAFKLQKTQVEIATPGNFSVYNGLTAIAICRHFDISEEIIRIALLESKVKGRIEMIKVADNFSLMIDYAHNAMSLESLLTTLKEYNPTRLVCLFGCGGNRAKSRRYEMGEVSGRLADLTIITSDNPRFEEPQEIIDDIKIGMAKTKGSYVEIINRKEAIAFAIENGKTGDVIVLAGKGHEDYQEIKGVKYPMDERILIQEILAERTN